MQNMGVYPAPHFWANLTFVEGKSRVIEPSGSGLPMWRSDFSYYDEPDVIYFIWPTGREPNGEVGLYCIPPERWAEKHAAKITVGLEFSLVEGRMLVARGVVTRVAAPEV